MAKEGDTFVPMTAWTVVAFKGVVGFETTWAETLEDFAAGKRQQARLLIAPEKAEELAKELLSQAAIARQRAQPN